MTGASQPLPIPAKTMERTGKYHDAARLYIHSRITNLNEIARILGWPNAVHLNRVKIQDDWDGFVSHLAATQIKSVWGEHAQLGSWNGDDARLVKAERERQIAMIPSLIEEVDRVSSSLRLLEPGSKPYASASSALRLLTEMLSDFSGLDRWWKACEMAQKASKDGPKADASPERVAKGTVVDLS